MIASVSAKASASASRAHSSAETLKLTKAQAKEVIEKDLESWTAKFRAASEKTLADLKSQIDEISDKAHDSKHGAVEKEIINLQKLVDSGFSTLKAKIVSLVQPLSSDSIAEEKAGAEGKLLAATRRLGTEIRDKAQEIRKDAEKYLAKVYDDVSEAADQHLEVLDGINDMGMQELGMKWAWMDFVSYKDWARYHDLKKGMRESRTSIIRSAESNKKLKEITKWVESEWEGKATSIAKKAAEELKRVKGAGKRKIELTDSSDNFSDDYIPIPGKKANQQILGGAEKAKQTVVPSKDNEDILEEEIINAAEDAIPAVEVVTGTTSSKPGVESVVPTTSKAAENVASQAFGTTYGTEPEAATVVSEASDSVSSVASGAPERVKSRIPGGVEAGFVATAESVLYDEEDMIANDARSRLAEASRAVSEAVAHAAAAHPTPVAESLRSRYSELSESAVYAASSVLYGTPTPVAEQMVSIATDKYSAAVAAASSVIYGEPTPVHELYLQKVKQAYIQAIEAAEDSLKSANRLVAAKSVENDKSVRESMYSVALGQYSAAIAAAAASSSSVSIRATKAMKSYDSVVADAERKWQDVLSAASTKVYGTPQPASESVMSAAQERYSQALAEAEKTYDSWFSAASAQVYGTPTPVIKSMSSKASLSASSIASSGSSVASEAAASVTSVVVDMAGIAQLRYLELQNLVSELIHNKEPSFSESVVSRVSSIVYGTPTPILSHASSYLVSATSAAAQAVASMPPAIDTMISDAVSRVKAAAAEASEAVYGKEPTQLEKYQQKLRALGEEAVNNVSVAIYGTPKGSFEQATETVISVASEAAEKVVSAVDGAKEAAQSVGVKLGILEAQEEYKQSLVEIAKKRIGDAIETAEEGLRGMRKAAEEYKEKAEEVFESTKERIRDEL
jgi:hypothetical protein